MAGSSCVVRCAAHTRLALQTHHKHHAVLLSWQILCFSTVCARAHMAGACRGRQGCPLRVVRRCVSATHTEPCSTFIQGSIHGSSAKLRARAWHVRSGCQRRWQLHTVESVRSATSKRSADQQDQRTCAWRGRGECRMRSPAAPAFAPRAAQMAGAALPEPATQQTPAGSAHSM